MTAAGFPGRATVLVVDMANVVGSVPDGWWHDRAAAAERLLTGLDLLAGRTVPGPNGAPIEMAGIVAVLEGNANAARRSDEHTHAGPVEVIRATGSGDDEIVEQVARVSVGGRHVLVVTADRGLRARLPALVATTGPGWINGLLDRRPTRRRPSE